MSQHSHPPVPDVFGLVGHPARWALLSELALSDRRVGELAAALGMPQNGVSYHLARLRSSGLVSCRRSQADRRDLYYAADLDRYSELIAEAGVGLHPAARLIPVWPVTDGSLAPPTRVPILFLCSGNSARSQLAEALAGRLGAKLVDPCSAGSRPRPLHPNAVRVLRERGIDISTARPKSLEEFLETRFGYVVTLCDRVREVCPEFPGLPETTHWSIANPATGDPDDVTYPLFQRTAAELATRIEFLLAVLADRTPAPRASRREAHAQPQ